MREIRISENNFIDAGLIDYAAGYQMQKKAVEDVLAGGRDRLILCEHTPVLTLGRMSKESFILAPRQELQSRGIDIIKIDRGGEVTLHAPGQLVVYPILDLRKHGKDLKLYMHRLEETAIRFLKIFGISSSRNPGKTGVWVGSQKIVSIGVGVKKWVAFHGAGINLNTDLSLFRLINPCGLGAAMTSVSRIAGREIDVNRAKNIYAGIFRDEFNFDRS